LVQRALEHQNELSFDSGGKEQAVRAYEEALNAVFDLRVECHQHIQPYASRKDGTIKWALLEMWPLLVCSSTELISIDQPCMQPSDKVVCYNHVQNITRFHVQGCHAHLVFSSAVVQLCAHGLVTSSSFFAVSPSETLKRVCTSNANVKSFVTTLLLIPYTNHPSIEV